MYPFINFISFINNKDNYHFLLFLLIIILLILLYRIVYISNINNFDNQDILSEIVIPNEKAYEILQKGILNNSEIINIITNTKKELQRQEKQQLKQNINNETKEMNIPARIHFIWIGSKIADKYISNISTYIKNNPNYEIWLWHDDKTSTTDERITNLQVNMHNINELRELNFRNAFGFENMKNWAGKADILRYEIIYNFGGMYIDVDSISVKPFDELFVRPYVCIETKGLYNNIQNAQFAFSSKSAFLEFVIECLNKNISYHMNTVGNLDDILSVCGPPFFTTCFYYWKPTDVLCINQDYLIHKNQDSYSYHTMDKNW